MARPSKYSAAFAEQAAKLAHLGATDQEVADFFKVDVRTVHRWKHDHEEFCHSLKAGKDAADERVERSLYQRAVGYEQDEVKIFMPGGAVEPVYAPFRAKIAPDVTAAIFWLKNRRSDQWRDVKHIDGKQQVTHSYDLDGLPDERLDELERILADASGREGGESEATTPRLH